MIRRLREFLGLPPSDQALLVETAALLAAIRAGLCVLPFRVLRRVLVRMASAAARRSPADRAVAERVGWAVGVAGRHVPACRLCLAQALAAEVLLARRGCPARFRIGVARPAESKLQAHAWVESGGAVVVGGRESASRFTPLRLLAATPEET